MQHMSEENMNKNKKIPKYILNIQKFMEGEVSK